jgi:hypothetical protein
VIKAARRTGQLGPVIAGIQEAARPHGRSRRRRAIASMAAAAAVIAVAGGVAAGTHYADLRSQRSQQQARTVEDVLRASDAVMRSAPVSTGGMAIVVSSRHERMAVFIAHDLRALPRGKCYELWLMGPHGEHPAGRLMMRANGMSGPAVIHGMSAGDMVGLTVEPASGSLRPTSAPVVMIGRPGR